MTKFLAVTMIAIFLPVFAQAAPMKKGGAMDTASESVDPDKGDGCGLGWQVTQKRTMLATTTRATTNAFVPPTFGMTSGTIGCEQHAFAKNEENTARFVATNQDVILMEMAMGHGEYLSGLARTLGCSDAQVSAFSAGAQAQVSSLSSASLVQMIQGAQSIAVASGCGV